MQPGESKESPSACVKNWESKKHKGQDQIVGLKLKDYWQTPQALFDELNKEFRFTLDVCANADNAKCRRYFDEQMDGLKQSWAGQVCWMNPPYSQVSKWLAKAHYETVDHADTKVVALINVATDTQYWHSHVINAGCEVRFLKGRVRFVPPIGLQESSPRYASAIVIYDPPKFQRYEEAIQYPPDQRLEMVKLMAKMLGVNY
jgi:phage N-6-adenine-methyltransferase